MMNAHGYMRGGGCFLFRNTILVNKVLGSSFLQKKADNHSFRTLVAQLKVKDF